MATVKKRKTGDEQEDILLDAVEDADETLAAAARVRKQAQDADDDGDDDSTPAGDTDADAGEKGKKEAKKRAPVKQDEDGEITLRRSELDELMRQVIAPVKKRLDTLEAENRALRAAQGKTSVVAQLAKRYQGLYSLAIDQQEHLEGLAEEVDDLKKSPARTAAQPVSSAVAAKAARKGLRGVDRGEDAGEGVDDEANRLLAYDAAMRRIDEMDLAPARAASLRKRLKDKYDLEDMLGDLEDNGLLEAIVG